LRFEPDVAFDDDALFAFALVVDEVASAAAADSALERIARHSTKKKSNFCFQRV
jgi:hypothetical protein